jgi:hypothetical protein
MTLAGISGDLFLLACASRLAGVTDGRTWEQRVYDHMALRSVPVESIPGGYRVFGFASISGLHHQVDLTMGATDALVILECKAYRTALPKNGLLRFKAVTDDYYMALGASLPRRPVMRLFGGPGVADREMRRYAALHGIVIVDQERWPVPFLMAHASGSDGPSLVGLGRLSRPVQSVLERSSDGTYHTRPLPGIDALLDLHDRASSAYWEEIDSCPGAFEDLLVRRIPRLRGAA